MRIYIIGNDGITLCRKAPATVNDGDLAVASNEELHAAPLRADFLVLNLLHNCWSVSIRIAAEWGRIGSAGHGSGNRCFIGGIGWLDSPVKGDSV